MGNQTRVRHAVQGSNDVEKEMEGEKNDWNKKKAGERQRLRNQELLEVFTHTDTPTYAHTYTHGHTQHLLYCVYLSMDAPTIW